MVVGELSALLAALTFAVSNVLNKFLTGRLAPVPLNAIRTSSAAVFLVALFFALGKAADIPSTPFDSVLLIVAGGVLTTGVGDTLFLLFIRRVDISRAATLSFSLMTLMMVGSGALLLDEEVTWVTLAGALLVVSGVYLLSGYQRRRAGTTGRLWIGSRGMAFLLVVVLLHVTGLSLMRVGLREADSIIGNTARISVIAFAFLIAVSIGRNPQLGPHSASRAWARRRAQPWPSRRGTGGAAPLRVRIAYHTHPRVFHMRGTSIDLTAVLLGAFAGALSLGLGTTLLFIAFQRSGAAISTILINSQVLWLTPLSMVFLKERVTPRTVLGILVTLGGITIVLL
ncbi:MAG: DMT family transporter [Dehalococcoidia bacterium]